MPKDEKEAYLQGRVDFVDDNTSVSQALQSAKPLRQALAELEAKIRPLTLREKERIVDQAIMVLEQFYVHLPMKRAMHAVNPIQRLRILRQRLQHLPSDRVFHDEMASTFTSVRDLHTRYTLPAAYAGQNAFLPFRVEAYGPRTNRRYIVSKVVEGFSDPRFKPGVRIDFWNGIPIARAVELAAGYHAGSNPDARHAAGVDGLTKRVLSVTPPPDEEWVTVGYRTLRGAQRETRVDWLAGPLPPELRTGPERAVAVETEIGLDVEGDMLRRINKMLFAPAVVEQKALIESVEARPEGAEKDRAMSAALEAAGRNENVPGIPSMLPHVFLAKEQVVDGRNYAYLRIFTFYLRQAQHRAMFMDEVLRLLDLLPRTGLILDVRGNTGGLITLAERLLQLFTPRRIEPCRFQFICSQANLTLCKKLALLNKWAPSLERALESGATFSAAYPLTPECNDLGQRYYGPVILVTDARSYSATDILAAGFRDNEAGDILGVDWSTGAGGANVWNLEDINRSFNGAGLRGPLRPLAREAGLRVAIRRTLRVGREAGTELEDFGVAVQPEFKHDLTRNDVLKDNVDLIAHAARLLAGKPVYDLQVEHGGDQGTFRCTAATIGTEYVEAFCNGKHQASRDVDRDWVDFEFPAKQGATVELRGHADGQVVSMRRLTVA